MIEVIEWLHRLWHEATESLKLRQLRSPLILSISFLIGLGLACQTLSDLPDSADSPTAARTPKAVRSLDAIWQPKPGTSWQWQLTGSIDTSYDVEMYDIDLFDTPQEVIDELKDDGRIVICYFSAGSWEEWRPDASQFPEKVIGRELSGWPDEKWLDISQINSLEPIMLARLDLAVQKGCDGVEPDNVTAFQNDSGFSLTAEDQLNYNVWLATAAHERGLSLGLKNDLDQIVDLEPYFDWALNEQCFQYDECEALLPFVEAGKAVFGVEYELEADEFCPQANSLNFDWLQKELDLDAWRVACR